MEIEALWERADRLGWRTVELAAWHWAYLAALAGRVDLAALVETELVANGVDGLELMWEVCTLSDADISFIILLADERAADGVQELAAV